jgi:hypothetical protein
MLKTTELTSELGNQMILRKEFADKEVNEMKEAIKVVQTEIINSAQTWQKEAESKVQNLNVEFK